ncbi:helix-turn-helix domain-containing protein [Paenibacillus hodogayensis]|uniref:Helix-turn-helix domain-containing protein n=1 Tax=Paenibacillus hodogayensis TaxID=279208 RepID=A0ABV5VYD7_9BACL
MKKNWFYRLLLSYLPVFLVMIAAVLLIAFAQLSRYSKQETVKANEAFMMFMKQSLDVSLMNMDELAVDFVTKAHVSDFYYNPDKQNEQMLAYQLSTEMYRMVLRSDLIDSMYLYRGEDDVVLSYDMLKPRSEFGDREFIDVMRQTPFTNYYWSDVRSYRPLSGRREEVEVVSLVRQVPLLTGTHGLLVVNVNTESVRTFVTRLFGDNRSYFTIADRYNVRIADNEPAGGDGFGDWVRVPLAQPDSTLTGWHFESGIKGGTALAAASVFSYVGWLTLLVVVVPGIVWIIVLSRRHYRPLEKIVDSIGAYSLSRTQQLVAGRQDEFRFIQSALDDLVKQSNDFRQQYAEGLVYQHRQRFFDLMYGSAAVGPDEWVQLAEAMELSPPYRPLLVAAMEIDRYHEFDTRYSRGDQNLLKFVLTSMVKEMAAQYRFCVLKEWMSPEQLAILIQAPAAENPKEGGGVLDFGEEIRRWVDKHMQMTVTLAISFPVEGYERLPEAYEAAAEALKYKTTLGSNRVIQAEELERQPVSDLFQNTRLIRNVVLAIKNSQEEWREELILLFDEMRRCRLNRDDISSLLAYLSYQLSRELAHLPGDIWRESYEDWNGRLVRLLDTCDVLDDLQRGALYLLEMLAEQVAQHREHQPNKELIRQVKAYIEQHYHDPDISLVHIADRFGIKYVSQFFKDEIGEKFSDYLTRVRIEKAQALLQETQDSVQQVAARVGYAHSFSFIRMFKRIVGTTPGDYRKEQSAARF